VNLVLQDATNERVPQAPVKRKHWDELDHLTMKAIYRLSMPNSLPQRANIKRICSRLAKALEFNKTKQRVPVWQTLLWHEHGKRPGHGFTLPQQFPDSRRWSGFLANLTRRKPTFTRTPLIE